MGGRELGELIRAHCAAGRLWAPWQAPLSCNLDLVQRFMTPRKVARL